MILVLAIFTGLIAGLARARVAGHTFGIPSFRSTWLLWLAVTPQLVAFHLHKTAYLLPDKVAAGILVTSQVLLLAFVWNNRALPGFCILGAGLGLNLLVIALNGGLMPISPATVRQIAPAFSITPEDFGARLGSTKDVLLPPSETILWWLSDVFVLPAWIPYRVAFSFGDVMVALGAFWLFWSYGNLDPVKLPVNKVAQT